MSNFTITEEEFKDIQQVVMSYSMGNFSERIKLHGGQDEKDTVRAAINMLGEELEVTTVSRDYLDNIYNAVQDMVFIMDKDGMITDINDAVEKQLGFDRLELIGHPVESLMDLTQFDTPWKKIKKALKKNPSHAYEQVLTQADKIQIPVIMTASTIMDRYDSFKGYLTIARDISDQKATERLIVQTIVKTQEKEQKRVAEDLHDSLGQELSGLKLFLNALEANNESWDESTVELLDATKKVLDEAIVNLRNICFNLMPKSLAYDGISAALQELFTRLNQQKKMRFELQLEDNIKPLNKGVEMLLFRISQEFINNTIKHASAKKVILKMGMDNMRLKYSIGDDGKGFELDKVKQSSMGRGLSNMESRVKAFNGNMVMNSEKGKGTSLFISFQLSEIL